MPCQRPFKVFAGAHAPAHRSDHPRSNRCILLSFFHQNLVVKKAKSRYMHFHAVNFGSLYSDSLIHIKVVTLLKHHAAVLIGLYVILNRLELPKHLFIPVFELQTGTIHNISFRAFFHLTLHHAFHIFFESCVKIPLMEILFIAGVKIYGTGIIQNIFFAPLQYLLILFKGFLDNC